MLSNETHLKGFIKRPSKTDVSYKQKNAAWIVYQKLPYRNLMNGNRTFLKEFSPHEHDALTFETSDSVFKASSLIGMRFLWIYS